MFLLLALALLSTLSKADDNCKSCCASIKTVDRSITRFKSTDHCGEDGGIIPDEIGELTALTYLSLWGRKLSGTIPSSIQFLTALTELVLNDNQFTALPQEIFQLTALESLTVKDNQLTALPREISQLSALTLLSLNFNQLAAIPNEISQLTALTYLGLVDNELTTLPRKIAQLPLTHLTVRDNKKLECLPSEINSLRLEPYNNDFLAGNYWHQNPLPNCDDAESTIALISTVSNIETTACGEVQSALKEATASLLDIPSDKISVAPEGNGICSSNEGSGSQKFKIEATMPEDNILQAKATINSSPFQTSVKFTSSVLGENPHAIVEEVFVSMYAYVLGLPGGTCPTGRFITTLEECRTAVSKLGISSSGEWTTPEETYVYGCSIKYTQNNMLHFNTKKNARARGSETPVCKSGEFLELEHEQCDSEGGDDYVLLRDFAGTEEECLAKCAELSCTGFTRVPLSSKCTFQRGSVLMKEEKDGDKSCYLLRSTNGPTKACHDMEPPSWYKNNSCVKQSLNGKCPARKEEDSKYCRKTCGLCN